MSYRQVWQGSEREGYQPAAVCKRGHVLKRDISSGPPPEPRCAACGAPVLTACPSCDFRIRGRYIVPGVIGLSSDYRPPNFCDKCGSPLPWAGREARVYELENLLDEQELSPSDELAVREALASLREPEGLDEDEQTRRWGIVARLAPGLVESGRQIIVSIASEAAVKAMGLR